MLNQDLAKLYGVKTKALNQAVKRNIKRFPHDFMFQLTNKEGQELLQQSGKSSRSQFVTLKQGHNIKYLPYVFTEQGVAMLSSVLKSGRAILVNVAIMRAFVKLRSFIFNHKELTYKLNELEMKFKSHTEKYDADIKMIFEAITQLMTPPPEKPKKIGFLSDR